MIEVRIVINPREWLDRFGVCNHRRIYEDTLPNVLQDYQCRRLSFRAVSCISMDGMETDIVVARFELADREFVEFMLRHDPDAPYRVVATGHA